MTTDTELRDLLVGAAGGPTEPDWDGVVRRGRHHRRVARVRLAGGAAAAIVALGLGSLLIDRQEATTVVVDQPEATTTTVSPPTIGPGVSYPIGADARASGVFVTISIEAADPPTGFDPCQDRLPIVVENADSVVVAVRDRYDAPTTSAWAACQSSAFSGWGTIELATPLGARRLLDENGREIPVIDNADLLFPTFVPAPFVLEAWDELGGEPLVDRTFSWSADDLHLSIRNAPLEGSVPLGQNPGDGCPEGEPVMVRAAQGALCTAERGGFVLLWDEGGWRRQVELGPVSDNVSPFTFEDLMAVVEGLEPLG